MLPDFLSFPSKIQLQTMNLCNYACTMCPYPKASAGRNRVEISTDLFHRMIEEVREARRKVKLCIMLQNEPLLDRRFIEFLDYAHRAEDAITSISTVTNGSRLTKDLLDQLVAYERFYLTISVNATDAERYRAVHNRDLWDGIHQLLTEWTGRREWVRLSFVADSTSVVEARAFQSYWRALGYQTRLTPLNSRVNALPVTSPLQSIDRAYGHCHYPVDTLNVLADGSVILCCNDWGHAQRFGNLHMSSIAEVWNSPSLIALRTAAIEGRLRAYPMCRNCDYPMRSSERMRLEAMVSDAPGVQNGSTSRGVREHITSIYPVGSESRCPVLVQNISEENGTIMAFADVSVERLGVEVLFEFRIGHAGAFSFGSLMPVRCPGRLSVLPVTSAPAGISALRIDLDRGAPEFQFLPWYYADWCLSD